MHVTCVRQKLATDDLQYGGVLCLCDWLCLRAGELPELLDERAVGNNLHTWTKHFHQGLERVDRDPNGRRGLHAANNEFGTVLEGRPHTGLRPENN